MMQLAAQAAKQLGEEAKESGDLAREAKPLDAEAAQDLGDAQQQAQKAAGNPSATPARCRPPRTGSARTSPRPRPNWPAASSKLPPSGPGPGRGPGPGAGQARTVAARKQGEGADVGSVPTLITRGEEDGSPAGLLRPTAKSPTGRTFAKSRGLPTCPPRPATPCAAMPSAVLRPDTNGEPKSILRTSIDKVAGTGAPCLHGRCAVRPM